MKHFDYEINSFIDGELDKEKHNELFSHLSICGDCQSLLADSLALKEKSRIYCAKNLNEIKGKPKEINKFYKFGFYASAFAAVILVFLLISVKPKEVLVTKNEVRVDTVFVDGENSNTQKLIADDSSLHPGYKELVKPQQEYLHYVMNLRTERFTEADLNNLTDGSTL